MSNNNSTSNDSLKSNDINNNITKKLIHKSTLLDNINSSNELYNEQGIMKQGIDKILSVDEGIEYNDFYDNTTKFDIGKNIIYKNKYVFGIKENLSQMISVLISFLLLYLIFIIYIFPYFFYNSNKIIFIPLFLITTFIYLIAQYYHFKCFFTEPGIIPRRYPPYQKTDFCDKFIFSKVTKKPIIMVQRHCHVCGIKRPHKCLHCSMCDNCVEEFDHHCIYVSNCIGKRNRKFYFSFLIMDFLFLLKISTLSVIQFCLVFQKYTNELKQIFSNINIPIIFIVIILAIMSINIFTHSQHKKIVKYITILIDFIYGIAFYYSKKKSKNNLPLYVSPFNMIMLTATAPMIFYFFVFTSEQLSMISIDMTTSEYKNLINYRKAINKNQSNDQMELNNINGNYNSDLDRIKNNPCTILKEIPSKKHIPKLKFIESIKNIWRFLLKKTPPSLLYREEENY